MSNQEQELTFTYSWTKEDVERMLSDRKGNPITISDGQWEALCWLGDWQFSVCASGKVFDENFLDSLMDHWLVAIKEEEKNQLGRSICCYLLHLHKIPKELVHSSIWRFQNKYEELRQKNLSNEELRAEALLINIKRD